MKNDYLLFLVRKHIKDKNNIFFGIILFLVMFIIFIALTMINFVFDFKKDTFNQNLLSRTLWVEKDEATEEEYEKINKIDHVVFNVSTKYLNSAGGIIEEFNSDRLEGYLEIYPLINKDEITILNGTTINNNLEAICPQKFYPHEMMIKENGNLISKIYNSEFIDGDKLIGSSFTIPSSNSSNPNIKVKIVGTYNPKEIFGTINSCYISMEDFESIVFPYSLIMNWTDSEGNTHIENEEYSGRLVRVDKYEKIEFVVNELQKLGFSSYLTFTLDEGYLNLILYIPLFISIIVIIISYGLIRNFLIKKIKNRRNNYGILKSSGYTNNKIIKSELVENLIIFILEFIIAAILYFLTYNIVYNLILSEFIFNSASINIPFIIIIISIILLGCMIVFMNKRFLNKNLEFNIQDLLKDK